MADREITFRLRARDESGQAFESLKTKAQTAGSSMETVVSKDLGNRMRHFNETGAKATFLLGQMGGSAGQAAGKVTQLGGAASMLVGKMTVLEAGILGAGEAVLFREVRRCASASWRP